MQPKTVIVEVERWANPKGAGEGARSFACYFDNRGRRPVVFQPDVVPTFPGDKAMVELDTHSWPWRILKIVSPSYEPGHWP